MTHKKLLELESSFEDSFNELAHHLKQSGCACLDHSILAEKYWRLSTQINAQLECIAIYEQSLGN